MQMRKPSVCDEAGGEFDSRLASSVAVSQNREKTSVETLHRKVCGGCEWSCISSQSGSRENLDVCVKVVFACVCVCARERMRGEERESVGERTPTGTVNICDYMCHCMCGRVLTHVCVLNQSGVHHFSSHSNRHVEHTVCFALEFFLFFCTSITC